MIRGVYRRAFVHGQLVCRRAGDAIARLATAGIDAMALKGGALIAFYDGNPALRPMNDFDVLVRREHAVAAIGTLTRAGWRAQWPRPERLPEAYHGACFVSPVGRVDRRSYEAAMAMPGVADYLMRPWRRYRLRARHVPAWRALPGFVRYLEITMGQPHWRALPAEIVMRVRRFRRDRRLGVR